MGTNPQETGELHQVIWIETSRPIVDYYQWQSVRYTVPDESPEIVWTRTAELVATREGVGAYLGRRSNSRPLCREDLEACGTALLHWVRKLRRNQKPTPLSETKLTLGWASAQAFLDKLCEHIEEYLLGLDNPTGLSQDGNSLNLDLDKLCDEEEGGAQIV